MARWTDIATWSGPIPNCGPGALRSHRGVVIHTAQGSFDGTVAWQRNPSADVGSHFVTAQDGRVVQLIDTDTRSWCQSAGNDDWISIENAGYGGNGEALTAGQVEACAKILARAHVQYGVPLRVSNSPSEGGLGWHGMGGAAWGGHTGCPGTAIRNQLPAIVARAQQIVGGSDMAGEADAAFAKSYTGTEPWVSGQSWMSKAVEAPLRAVNAKVDALSAKLSAPQPVTVDAAKVAVALAGNTAFVAAIAKAVADEQYRRMQG